MCDMNTFCLLLLYFTVYTYLCLHLQKFSVSSEVSVTPRWPICCQQSACDGSVIKQKFWGEETVEGAENTLASESMACSY